MLFSKGYGIVLARGVCHSVLDPFDIVLNIRQWPGEMAVLLVLMYVIFRTKIHAGLQSALTVTQVASHFFGETETTLARQEGGFDILQTESLRPCSH